MSNATILVPRPEPAPSLEAVRAYLRSIDASPLTSAEMAWRVGGRVTVGLGEQPQTIVETIARGAGLTFIEALDRIRAHEPAPAPTPGTSSFPPAHVAPEPRPLTEADVPRILEIKAQAEAGILGFRIYDPDATTPATGPSLAEPVDLDALESCALRFIDEADLMLPPGHVLSIVRELRAARARLAKLERVADAAKAIIWVDARGLYEEMRAALADLDNGGTLA